MAKSIEKKCVKLWNIIRRLRKHIESIRRSHKAKVAFFQLTGSTLPLPGKTRWNSHFLMINVFLKFAAHVKAVYLNHFPRRKYTVTDSDLSTLQEFAELTKVFQSAILRLQLDSVTSSKCYGIFRELLDATSDNFIDPVMNDLAKSMKEELLRRFGKYIDVEDAAFDPHFILCCLMDPHEAVCLSEVAPFKLSQIIKQRLPTGLDEVHEIVPNDATTSTLTFRDRMALNVTQKNGNLQNDEDSRIIKFVKEMLSGDHQNFKAADYWKNVSFEFKFLQHLAFSILAIPASSAPSEKVFSQCAIATKGLKNRTKEELLNNKLMVHLNLNKLLL